MLTIVIENISPRWKQVYGKIVDDYDKCYYQISISVSNQVGIIRAVQIRDQMPVSDQIYDNNNRREY